MAQKYQILVLFIIGMVKTRKMHYRLQNDCTLQNFSSFILNFVLVVLGLTLFLENCSYITMVSTPNFIPGLLNQY